MKRVLTSCIVIEKSLSTDSSSYPRLRIVEMKPLLGVNLKSPTPLPSLNKPSKRTTPASRCSVNCAFESAFGLRPVKSCSGKSLLIWNLPFPASVLRLSDSHSARPLSVCLTFAVQSPVILSCAAPDEAPPPRESKPKAANTKAVVVMINAFFISASSIISTQGPPLTCVLALRHDLNLRRQRLFFPASPHQPGA